MNHNPDSLKDPTASIDMIKDSMALLEIEIISAEHMPASPSNQVTVVRYVLWANITRGNII